MKDKSAGTIANFISACIFVFMLVIVAIGLGYIGWRLERWMNWKLCYSSKVDQRIEQLEKRIEKIERLEDK